MSSLIAVEREFALEFDCAGFPSMFNVLNKSAVCLFSEFVISFINKTVTVLSSAVAKAPI